MNMNIINRTASVVVASLALTAGYAAQAQAQAANAGAKFNQAERAQAQELRRLEKVDPPIKEDIVGNALVGGAVTGTLRGAAAGAAAAVRSGALTGTAQAVREDAKKAKKENAQTGRGSATDPRFDPRTLFRK